MAVQTPPPCLLRRRPAVEVQLRNPKHPKQNQTRAHRKHKPKRNKKLDSPTAGRFGRRTPRPATSSSGSGRGCRSPSRLTPNATTPPIQLPPIGGTIHEQIPSRAAPQSCARIRSPSAAPPPHRALLRSDAALCSPPLPNSRSIQPNQIKTKPKRAASRGEDSPVSTHPRAPPREAVAPRGDEKTARRSAEEEAGLRSEAKRGEAKPREEEGRGWRKGRWLRLRRWRSARAAVCRQNAGKARTRVGEEEIKRACAIYSVAVPISGESVRCPCFVVRW